MANKTIFQALQDNLPWPSCCYQGEYNGKTNQYTLIYHYKTSSGIQAMSKKTISGVEDIRACFDLFDETAKDMAIVMHGFIDESEKR